MHQAPACSRLPSHNVHSPLPTHSLTPVLGRVRSDFTVDPLVDQAHLRGRPTGAHHVTQVAQALAGQRASPLRIPLHHPALARPFDPSHQADACRGKALARPPQRKRLLTAQHCSGTDGSRVCGEKSRRKAAAAAEVAVGGGGKPQPRSACALTLTAARAPQNHHEARLVRPELRSRKGIACLPLAQLCVTQRHFSRRSHVP